MPKKATLKTQKTRASVAKFLACIPDPKKREDCLRVTEIMSKITQEKPALWGDSIVGFGSYHYIYDSGREGDWPLCGFSPRKQNLTLYIMTGFKDEPDLMNTLGTYRTGSSCLYLKQLDDVHLPTLRKLIRKSVTRLREKWPPSQTPPCKADPASN